MIMWQLPETTSLDGSTPTASSPSSSSSRTRGSTTTPSAITDVMCGYRIPEGISWSLSVCPSARIVWPALFPPWYRTTRSIRSAR